MINDGTKVLDATMDEIRSRFDPRVILFEPMDAGEPAVLEQIPGIDRVEPGEGEWRIFLGEDCRPADAIRALVNTIPAVRVELQRPTLEDIFIQIVTETSPASVQEIQDIRAALSNEASVQEAV